MLHLAAFDWGVIVLYLGALLALGFSARLRDHSLLQYLAAGRSLSLPAFVASLVSTWYGGILGVGDSVKAYGLGSLLLNGVPYYAFALLYAVFYAKHVRAADQISIPERIANRWGRHAGLLAGLLIFLLAVPAAHVLMLGTLLSLLTQWQLPLAVLLATMVGTLFLYRGGLLADVRAGLLAFSGMYVGFMVIVGWCLVHYPLGQILTQVKSQSPALGSVTGGQGSLAIVSFFILGAWTLVDPGFHQRVSSAASPEVGRKGVLVSVLFWLLFDLLSITTGLYAMALLPKESAGLTLFPELGDKVLPPGLKALFLCGMAGTILSAMVGYTLVAGATFGREVVARLKPSLSEDAIKQTTRGGFALSSLIAIILALSVKNVAVDLWYAYAGAVVGSLLLPVAAVYVPQVRLKAGSAWVNASMGVSFVVSFAWLIYARQTNNAYLLVKLAGQEFSLGTLVPGLLVSAALLGLGEVQGRRFSTDG